MTDDSSRKSSGCLAVILNLRCILEPIGECLKDCPPHPRHLLPGTLGPGNG